MPSRQVHEFGSDRHTVWSSYPPYPHERGAMLLGERIRSELEATSFHTERGNQGNLFGRRRALSARGRAGKLCQFDGRGAVRMQARRSKPRHTLDAEAAGLCRRTEP
jgi:hypothetical protein